MRFFLHYLRSRRLILCSFAAALLAFPLIFFLYGLPKQALLYTSALAALIGLCAFTADFLKFQRRHAQLARLLNFQEGMTLELPAPADALEADYQALLQLLEAREAERQTQQDRRYQDMCDYYTTWAHQIKTPIAAMRLNLKNEDSPLSRRLLSDLMRVERYAEMVMAYLRVESPSTDYLLRRLCIDDAVKRAVRPFAGEFIARRLKLNYEETGLSAVSDENGWYSCWSRFFQTRSSIRPRAAFTFTAPRRTRSRFRTRASASRRRICRACSKRATRGSTGAAT